MPAQVTKSVIAKSDVRDSAIAPKPHGARALGRSMSTSATSKPEKIDGRLEKSKIQFEMDPGFSSELKKNIGNPRLKTNKYRWFRSVESSGHSKLLIVSLDCKESMPTLAEK